MTRISARLDERSAADLELIRRKLGAASRSAGRSLSESPITAWPVLTETCHLLQQSLGVTATIRFLSSMESSSVDVFALDHSHVSRIGELMLQSASLPMDLADASLVIPAEHLGHGRILSTDRRDFGIYRWKNHDPFNTLLFPDD